MIDQKMNYPWIIITDLNELSSPNDKLSFSQGNSIRYNNFNHFVNTNNLIDFSFSGNPYTWHNKKGD